LYDGLGSVGLAFGLLVPRARFEIAESGSYEDFDKVGSDGVGYGASASSRAPVLLKFGRLQMIDNHAVLLLAASQKDR